MRYKKYKGRSFKVLKMKFQSFVDISTQADTMKIISVSAGGKNVLSRLSPFFNAYKYYKLGGVSIKLIPASTLPVDPLQLSYDASDLDAVDPRDQLTPGMCRITNGEDILENITGLTGDQQRELYNNMLLDTRWFKWMLQTGVKRFGKPRYWQVGQLHQDKWPGAVVNMPLLSALHEVTDTAAAFNSLVYGQAGVSEKTEGFSSPYGLFQTGHRGVLGWMPTDGLQKFNNGNDEMDEKPFLAAVPEIELFKILMPPVRKTNYFYRMFITETVYFREPIVLGVNNYRPIDVFHVGGYNTLIRPKLPTDSQYGTDTPSDAFTGGNYGDS